jgi:hypothetical protein
MSVGAEDALRSAADQFHKILAGLNSAKLLARNGHKMPSPMFDKLSSAVLSNDEIVRTAADGFETCVRALAALGAKDVTIHECGEQDLEIF